jgi:hypothetical protein
MRITTFAISLWLLAASAASEEPVDVWIDPAEAGEVWIDEAGTEHAVDAQAYRAPEAAPVTGQALQALVAPVALYPDDLLAVVLPAATYPDQVYEAGLFLAQTSGDATREPPAHWDESVVALLNYPDVVILMNEDPEWTSRLGNMVLYDQQLVLEAVAGFREVAYLAGNLTSDDRQIVEREDGVVRVRPADPAVIYVPDYEPFEVTRHRAVALRYYPEPCAVYYYPYPAGYRLPRSYFWGVTSAYQIRWSTWDLAVHPHWYHDHPYYRQPYWPDRYYYYSFGHTHYRDWPWYSDRYRPTSRPWPREAFGWRHRAADGSPGHDGRNHHRDRSGGERGRPRTDRDAPRTAHANQSPSTDSLPVLPGRPRAVREGSTRIGANEEPVRLATRTRSVETGDDRAQTARVAAPERPAITRTQITRTQPQRGAPTTNALSARAAGSNPRTAGTSGTRGAEVRRVEPPPTTSSALETAPVARRTTPPPARVAISKPRTPASVNAGVSAAVPAPASPARAVANPSPVRSQLPARVRDTPVARETRPARPAQMEVPVRAREARPPPARIEAPARPTEARRPARPEAPRIGARSSSGGSR